MAKEAAKETAKKSITKGQFLADIAEIAEMTKADVAKVMEAMEEVIVKQLGPKGPGTLALPGLFKLKAKRIPAQKGGKVVPNRFKPGETTVTKDKPASTKVTARPLKKLKESLAPASKK
ncbi:MAG: HU family DNA-binding protein [Fimbriiglobus sp.]